jgi:hypothetical protein
MRAKSDRGCCLVCGDVLSNLQTVVCSPHCRSVYNFGIRACHSQAMKDRLAVMWHAGEKVAVIALELGVSVNVVVSLRRRIPLPERPNPVKRLASGQEPKRRRVASAPRVTLPQFPLPAVPFMAPRKPQQQKAPEPKQERPAKWTPFKTCQWIEVATINPKFCCAPTQPGSAYCAKHHARCYIRTPKLDQWSPAA